MQTKITTDCLKNNDHGQFNTAQQLSQKRYLFDIKATAGTALSITSSKPIL